MFGALFKLKEQIEGNRQSTKPVVDRKTLAPTQDAVEIIDAQDDVLILRNYSVVAAIGFGSLNDTLLSENELSGRLASYRTLLKNTLFDFQMLISTRPQNLDAYLDKLRQRSARLDQLVMQLDAMQVRLSDFIADSQTANEARFAQHFGFTPQLLFALPGGAHEVALLLSQADVVSSLRVVPQTDREATIAEFKQKCEETQRLCKRYNDLIKLRTKHVELEVEALHSPVRTFYLVTAFNPRLLNKTLRTALTDAELAKAKIELDRRCAHLMHGLQRMRLPVWRVAHDELIEDIRHLYHPSKTSPAYSNTTARSINMRLASVT